MQLESPELLLRTIEKHNKTSYLNVLRVSSKLISAGLIAAIIVVFELPPKNTRKKL